MEVFLYNQNFFKYIKDDKSILEKKPLEKAASKKQLFALKHKGFGSMDTLRDRQVLKKFIKKKIQLKKSKKS